MMYRMLLSRWTFLHREIYEVFMADGIVQFRP